MGVLMSYLVLSTIERYLRNVIGRVMYHLCSKVSLIRKNIRGKSSMAQQNGDGDMTMDVEKGSVLITAENW